MISAQIHESYSGITEDFDLMDHKMKDFISIPMMSPISLNMTRQRCCLGSRFQIGLTSCPWGIDARRCR